MPKPHRYGTRLRRKHAVIANPSRPSLLEADVALVAEFDVNPVLLLGCASTGVPRGTPHARIVTYMGRDARGGSVDATASIEPCP